jgi:hypothetical protein
MFACGEDTGRKSVREEGDEQATSQFTTGTLSATGLSLLSALISPENPSETAEQLLLGHIIIEIKKRQLWPQTVKRTQAKNAQPCINARNGSSKIISLVLSVSFLKERMDTHENTRTKQSDASESALNLPSLESSACPKKRP